LVEAVRAQSLVALDRELAGRIVKAGQLTHYEADTVFVRQGDQDNDLFLILGGEVAVLVNDRNVATRQAGTHVGEMALVDPNARRSATLKTVAPTVMLRLAEHKFARLAKKHPDLWRRIAVEVARRLRERNSALRQPHSAPVLFIGSSSEGLKIAEEFHRNLSRKHRIVVRLWTDGVFQTSRTSIESLIAQALDSDFAALVLTADDAMTSRGKKRAAPRDNVVFELGLFMGALGRERIFILKPKSVEMQIPSDLLGVTWIDYQRGGPRPLRVRLKPACQRMEREIEKSGPR
jgi:predicted nucleotide-binding protein